MELNIVLVNFLYFGLARRGALYVVITYDTLHHSLFPNGSPLGCAGLLGDLFVDLCPFWVPFYVLGSPFLYFRLKNAQE